MSGIATTTGPGPFRNGSPPYCGPELNDGPIERRAVHALEMQHLAALVVDPDIDGAIMRARISDAGLRHFQGGGLTEGRLEPLRWALSATNAVDSPTTKTIPQKRIPHPSRLG